VLGLRAHGHREVSFRCRSPPISPAWCTASPARGDFVVCLGAGNITQWAYALPGEWKALG